MMMVMMRRRMRMTAKGTECGEKTTTLKLEPSLIESLLSVPLSAEHNSHSHTISPSKSSS